MPRFVDLPVLWRAINEIRRAEGLKVTPEAGKLEIAEEWVQRATLANEALSFIQGQIIADLIPEDQIDTDIFDPQDDAFEYVCKGDSSQLDLLLLTVPHAPMLREVLENFDEMFDA